MSKNDSSIIQKAQGIHAGTRPKRMCGVSPERTKILLLHKHPKISGALEVEASDSEIFDDQLEQAVIRFQNRHHPMCCKILQKFITLLTIN